MPCYCHAAGRRDHELPISLPARSLAHARFHFGYIVSSGAGPPIPSGDFFWFMPSAFVHPQATGHRFNYQTSEADAPPR